PDCNPTRCSSRWPSPSQREIAALVSRGQFLENGLVHSNTELEILQRKILVRRMRAAILKRQSKQQCFDAENLAKIGDDRNAATFSNQRRIFAKRFLEGTLGCFSEFVIRIGQIPWTGMTAHHLQTHSGRKVFLEMLFH